MLPANQRLVTRRLDCTEGPVEAPRLGPDSLPGESVPRQRRPYHGAACRRNRTCGAHAPLDRNDAIPSGSPRSACRNILDATTRQHWPDDAVSHTRLRTRRSCFATDDASVSSGFVTSPCLSRLGMRPLERPPTRRLCTNTLIASFALACGTEDVEADAPTEAGRSSTVGLSKPPAPSRQGIRLANHDRTDGSDAPIGTTDQLGAMLVELAVSVTGRHTPSWHGELVRSALIVLTGVVTLTHDSGGLCVLLEFSVQLSC
jgi:hypothetical protein